MATTNRDKRKTDSNTIIVEDFNSPLTAMVRSSKQKINKEAEALNDTLDQIDLTDIYRTFHPKAAEYTFFSSAHRTFSRIDHILGHRSSLSKFKKLNYFKHFVWSQCYENINQLQEKENSKIHKLLEAKQYATKQTMDHWRNQRGKLKDT